MAHGVLTVVLGGEQRVIKFNNYFLPALGEVLNIDPILAAEEIMLIGQKKPVRAMALVCYAGMMGYFESVANYTHGITVADVTGWVGEANDVELTGIWEVFRSAINAPKASEEAVAEYRKEIERKAGEIQKKRIKQTSNHG